jgi:anion-transporting  ArsA/GET3 family ATPase
MTKEQIANNINEFFKEYDTYNYRDNVSHKIDEEETIEEIANGLTNIEKAKEMLEKLNTFKVEAIDSECYEESKELEKITRNINEYIESNKLVILKVEPNELPYEKEIINDLKSLQNEVDGLIEMIDIDDDICLVCNEEGKLLGMDLNRVVGNDIIAGNFFISRFNEAGDLVSLTSDQIEKYKEKYNEKSLNEVDEKLVSLGFERGGKNIC